MMRNQNVRSVLENLVKTQENKYETIFPRMNDLALAAIRGQDIKTILEDKTYQDCLLILTMTNNIREKQGKSLDNELNNRLLKLSIKTNFLLYKFSYIIKRQEQSAMLSPIVQANLRSILNEFISAAWFDCKGDEQCQFALFGIYELVSMAGYTNDTKARQFLECLIKKSDAHFIKLMAIHNLLLEVSIEWSYANEEFSTLRLLKYQSLFDNLLKSILSQPSSTSLIRLEQAKSHCVAYRFHLICTHISHAANAKLPRGIASNRDGRGLWEMVVLAPAVAQGITKKHLAVLMTKEKELRDLHYKPAMDILKSMNLHDCPAEVVFFALADSTYHDGLEQTSHYIEVMRDWLTLSDTPRMKLTVDVKRTLTNYCDELCQLQTEWLAVKQIFSENGPFILRELYREEKAVAEAVAEETRINTKNNVLIQAINENVQQEIRTQRMLFQQMEERAREFANELVAKEEKQKARYACMRAKRNEEIAAKAAQQESPPYLPTANEVDEEAAENVVILPTHKSDALSRLEFFDKKIFAIISRLLRTAKKIRNTLNQRLTSPTRLTFHDRRLLDVDLKSTLNDYESLVAMKQRYLNLAKEVEASDSADVQEGIRESIGVVNQFDQQATILLSDAITLMKQVHELLERDRKAFIASIGEDEWERRGRINREKGYPASLATEEFRFFRQQAQELDHQSVGQQPQVSTNEMQQRASHQSESEALDEIQEVHTQFTDYFSELDKLQRTQAQNETMESENSTTYPPEVREIWQLLQAIPGEHYLFGKILRDLMRHGKLRPVCFVAQFASTCRSPGIILDAEINSQGIELDEPNFPVKFNSSRYKPNSQCRIQLKKPSKREDSINLFLTGKITANENPPEPLFFTIDLIYADEMGNIFDWSGHGLGLQDLKDMKLKTIVSPATIYQSHPEAILYTLFNMADGFMPDKEMETAIFHWQPTEDRNVEYLKALVLELIKQLEPEQRLQFASSLQQNDLFKKMFGLNLDKYEHSDEMLANQLEAWAFGDKKFDPKLFATVPQPVMIFPNISGHSQPIGMLKY